MCELIEAHNTAELGLLLRLVTLRHLNHRLHRWHWNTLTQSYPDILHHWTSGPSAIGVNGGASVSPLLVSAQELAAVRSTSIGSPLRSVTRHFQPTPRPTLKIFSAFHEIIFRRRIWRDDSFSLFRWRQIFDSEAQEIMISKVHHDSSVITPFVTHLYDSYSLTNGSIIANTS